uniref:Uncharacterized protein n=1 Tax=Romanomermis culicivorax TaxID=13658 RepID=A0A915IF55_ROMCU
MTPSSIQQAMIANIDFNWTPYNDKNQYYRKNRQDFLLKKLLANAFKLKKDKNQLCRQNRERKAFQ